MNITNVTLNNITQIINMSSGDPMEFLINMNHVAFGGWFYFIILWTLFIVLYMKAQQKADQPLINAMYIMVGITLISFFLRAISIVRNGVPYGLLSDWQMWIFPLITIGLAVIVKYMSDE